MKNALHILKRISDNKVFGSVTIYMALCLLLVMVLLCTTIESARVSAINARVRGATFMGLDSAFSEYALPVFEDYGVMMLWCGDDEFISKFEGYVTENLKTDDTSLLKATDLYKIEYTGSSLTDVKRAVDEDGDLFADQVYEYMKYFLTEEAASEILGEADIFEDGKKLNKFMDKIKKHKKTFIAVEKSVEKVKKKVEKVREIENAPARYIEQIRNSLDDYASSGDDKRIDEITKNENELKKTKNQIAGSLDEIEEEIEKYHDNVQKADAAVKEIESDINVDKDNMSSRVYENLKEEIDEIKIKSGEFDADYYGVEENQSKIEESRNALESLDSLFERLDGGIDEENVNEMLNAANHCKDVFSDFDLSGLEIKYAKEKISKEDSAFLDDIEQIFSKGIMAYIAPEVSDKQVDISKVPSSKYAKGASKDESIISNALEKVLFSEYIKGHFSRYTEKKEDHALDYEAEYILSGKKSDRENLSHVVNELVLLRSGCNLVSIIGDTQKKSEALALATALVGFTGMPVLIKLMQMVILSAWSMAEAFVDVKQLLEGEKVVTVKKNDEWHLSLSAVKEFAVEKINGKGSKKGYTYEEYLRILLLLQNKTRQIFRAMDVIEMNMQKNENEAFKIEDCIMDVDVISQYKAKALFVRFPFVKKYMHDISGNFGFEVLQNYSY